jgi:hypothetical protein
MMDRYRVRMLLNIMQYAPIIIPETDLLLQEDDTQLLQEDDSFIELE